MNPLLSLQMTSVHALKRTLIMGDFTLICNTRSVKLTCYQSSLVAQDRPHSTEQGWPGRGQSVCLVSGSSLAALIALVLKTLHDFRHVCNCLFIFIAMNISVLANVLKLALARLQKKEMDVR